ncbi:apoptosis-inducing factor 3-like isoform X2 [Crotalus tigris]|nr:apoptosis-inducing factor 3-like isoform X2 [Crotalus tigris]
MARECQLDHQTALLLGAGPAALTCAETLRQEGFTGRIIMATWENHLPYDKTKLTQDLGAPAESLYLRSQSFLDAHNIEVWKQREVVSVDPAGKMAHFRDGTSQAYSSLLIATGCSPRKLQCPGCSLGNVCTLLTPEDANWILAWALGKTVVIVGASFIGMEVAGNLVGKAAQVQVVEKEERPYQLTLGGQVGTVAMKMLEAQGVLFHLKTDVAQMQGENGKVTNVILSNGSVLPADLVVVGIGNTPNTSFVQGSSIKLDRTGSILVDLFMKTSAPSVFAAGDVASFPVALAGGKSTPIYHWQIAQAHGTPLFRARLWLWGRGGPTGGSQSHPKLKRVACGSQKKSRSRVWLGPEPAPAGGLSKWGTQPSSTLSGATLAQAQGSRGQAKPSGPCSPRARLGWVSPCVAQGDSAEPRAALSADPSAWAWLSPCPPPPPRPSKRLSQPASWVPCPTRGADGLSLSCPGRVAALNMLSRQRPLHTVPFFWTKLQSKTIRYAGYGTGHTETVPEGDLGQESFLLFYLRDGWVTAVASLNCDPLVAVVAETLYSGRRISKQEAETMMEAKELPKREPPQ